MKLVVNEYVKILNSQICSSVDLYVEDMEKVLLTLANDTSLPLIIDKKYPGTFEEYKANSTFFDKVNSLAYFKGYDIVFFTV